MAAHLVSDQRRRIRGRHETLTRFGIAAERFPAYVNPVVDLHDLDVVLLTFVLAGEGRHVMHGEDHPISGPSFGITRTGEKHGLITGDEPLEVVNVYLDVDEHAVPSLGAPLDLAIAALSPLDSPVLDRLRLPQVALEDVSDIRTILHMIVNETAHPRTGTGDAMSALKKLILTICAREIWRHGFITDATALGGVHAGIAAVRAHLDRTYTERHTLESLATMAHLERTYFSRLFSAHTGTTVTEYIARLRVQYSMVQLRNGRRPISEIAASSGFHDLSNFGRTFRRIAGTTPREYRRSRIDTVP